MKLSCLLAITALFTLTLGSFPILAAPNLGNTQPIFLGQLSPGYHAQGQGRMRRVELMEELNLSDEQKQQLAEIRQKYQQKLSPIRQKMRTSRQELHQMMGGNASNNAIRAKHQEIMQLQQQMGNLHFESMLEMREVLTPEQRREFAQLMDKRRNSGRHRGFNGPMEDQPEVLP